MFKSVIFDFNGVLADDEWVHMQAFQTVARAEGLEVSDRDYLEHYLPLADRDLFEQLFRSGGRALEPGRLSTLIDTKAGHYYRILGEQGRSSGQSVLFPGAREAIDAARRIGPVAIASGARREEIEFVLGESGLLERFDAIVAAEDVVSGKPDPEPYRRAANLLGIASSECVAVEDSLGGIESARRAGLRCLAVAQSYPEAELRAADWVIPRIGEFPPWLETAVPVP